MADCLSMEVVFIFYTQLNSHNIGLTIVYPPDTDTEGFINENIDKVLSRWIISANYNGKNICFGRIMEPNRRGKENCWGY
ncbi:hypothetical protein MXB_3172 [Myxobolus squamalis]|nr:hypothetical protein MXB_3172 [Myxobolus squamalis]